ncbi:MAG TPA: maltotransferase domain-containing protein, partial [Acetobacteraceae bacterium]|nr:maltotransferase domain-containing protein [Acetobacteraceae bacterium]
MAPRIYYLSPLLAGSLAGWRVHFERIARLGFDHVLIAPPFATGASGDMFLPADYGQLNASLEWQGDADAALATIARDCAAFGLTPLLDVVLDQVAAGSPLANPALFGTPDERAALDPRGPGGNFEAARVIPDAPGVGEWWAERLCGWLRAGIGGFRILSPAALPRPALRTLIETVRRQGTDALLLGWTPGANLDAIAEAGFDFVFSSLPWWDFHAEWFWTELDALSRIAKVIAAPEAPFGPRLATACHDPATLRPTYERNLSFAAMLAAGWMMPMGFEFATARRMDPACDAAEDFSRIEHHAPFDLSERIAAVNRARDGEPALASTRAPVMLAGAGSACVALLRGATRHPHQGDRASLILANADPSHRHGCAASTLVEAAGGAFSRFEAVLPRVGTSLSPGDTVTLEPGEVALYHAVSTTLAITDRPPLRQTAGVACAAPRIAIEAISPSVENGTFPAKRVAGETVTVEADVIADGHDVLGVALLWRGAQEENWRESRMHPLGNDRWQAHFPLAEIGGYQFTVEAWRDAFGSFRDELGKKYSAGVNTSLELREGTALVEEITGAVPNAELRGLVERLRRSTDDEQRALLLSPEVASLMAVADPRPFRVRAEPSLRIEAERTAARFASWYEIFPRSMSDDPHRHGNFADVIRHLPRIRDMGFDVLYFPPIHPIGRTNRKGRNNSLQPASDDPGSPYAIGGAEGGHDAIHPELGTLEEFRRLRDAAEQEGMELALDFAIQCSPDHPWLREHKDWFDWRPDGSLRYAENPPKKYEDIVNVDFYTPGAVPDLWIALCEVVLFWAGEGVRLFRV